VKFKISSTLLFIIYILFSSSIVFANKNLNAFFAYSVFYSPEKGSYIETNLTVISKSLHQKKIGSKQESSVNVLITFSDENNVIKAGNKYNVISQSVNDTSLPKNLVDVQRYFLKPGKYKVEVSLSDNNSTEKKIFDFNEEITVNYTNQQVNLSDIELVDSYVKTEKNNILSKSGYDLIPFSINYYPENCNKLMFYNEAYGTDSLIGVDKRVAFVYYIEAAETIEKIDGFFGVSKQKTQKVNVLFSQMDITQLVSGNYNLVTEIRDEKGLVLAQKKIYFQRRNKQAKIDLENLSAINSETIFTNKYNNKDSLKEFIACLWPISSEIERNWQETQIKNADVKIMQQYIYAFWKNRNDKNPEGEWHKYFEQVLYVNKVLACGKMKGYFTDRGRVYLQYGPPDAQQQVANEPDTYPYEIWQYYRIKDPQTGQFQTNKRFVFWNKDLDGNCYKLLHSDVRGELRDNRWQMRLKARTQNNVNLDVENPNMNTYGTGIDDLFSNPR
jgi:GWxTD domain-containing protein